MAEGWFCCEMISVSFKSRFILFALFASLIASAAVADPASRLEALEFNGVLKIGERVTLSFNDPHLLGTFWVQESKSKGDIYLVEFDSSRDVARVSLGNREREIKLKTETISAIFRPKILSAARKQEIEKQEIKAIYANDALVRARLEVVVAREERDSVIRSRQTR